MGNVYFTVRDLNSVFKLDRSGLLTRVAGFSTAGFSGDGGPATSARLLLAFQGDGWPAVMADSAGNLFIADVGNHRIRRISSDGIIATVAGGAYGFSGDGGPALQASLSYPIAVTAHAAGNVYNR